MNPPFPPRSSSVLGPDLAGDLVLGVSGLALGVGLAAAHDRRHARLEDGVHLLVHVVVGLAEQLPALAVAADDVRHVELGQHRSEEHTSELQSLMRISYAVFCLKKKNTTNNN